MKLTKIMPFIAVAATTPPVTPRKDLTSITDAKTIIDNVVGWVFAFFFALAAFYILMAAFDYLTAGGDSKKIDSAKTKLIYAAVGIAVALIARSVTVIIENFV